MTSDMKMIGAARATRTQVVNLKNIDLTDKTNNLLLNMTGGLLPEDLTKDEIWLLKQRFGVDWFNNLGYRELDGYKRPEE
jgi:hypothetical protein